MEFDFFDSDGNLILTGALNTDDASSEIGREFDGRVVASVAYSATQVGINRRKERDEVFAETLDRMNPLWYSALTTEQQTNLAAFRTQWLDYPNTGVEPTADVSDIFSR